MTPRLQAELLRAALGPVLLSAAFFGCTPQATIAGVSEVPRHVGDAPIAVSDNELSAVVHQLLRDGQPTPRRSALLAGVVRRQLVRAAGELARGDESAGARAVTGALYLLRVGDWRDDLLDASSLPALAGAIRKFSARGDEGRALALLQMKRALLAPGSAERARVDQHLASLQRWMTETRTGGPMVQRGANMRAAVARSLFEPQESARAEAARAVDAWIEQAVEYNRAYRRTGDLPPREEAVEAFRALQSGGTTMAALFLRHGDAAGALRAIEQTSTRSVVAPELYARVRAVAGSDSAEDWRELARYFGRVAFDEEEERLRMDTDLLDAALWGIAVQAYRRDPTSLAIGHILAGQLIGLGLAPAAPRVLQDALGPSPSEASLSAVLTTLVDALSHELAAGTLQSARSIFTAADGIMRLADARTHRGRLKPSGAQLRQLMAAIELRNGNVAEARPLMLKALEEEPTVWGFTMLGMLERQAGDLERALEHANRAVQLPNAGARALDVADAKLLAFEILRDQGAQAKADEALESALEIALAVRQGQDIDTKVRAERLLARVLDGYGDRSRAASALRRALEMADSHRQMLGPTMLSAVGRSLVYRDLHAARAALQTAMKAQIGEEDLVYGALWVMLLERELGKTPDGKVERVLSEAEHTDAWVGTLARWGRGGLDDEGLQRAAATYTQRIEALFYIAMNARAKGASSAASQLREVAENPLIDLMEVQLARDLLAPHTSRQVPERFKLP